VILDEAHRLRTVGSRVERDEDGNQTRVPTSQQALAAWALLHQARYRFELTGTPADRDVGDVWGLLHGIRPDWFPGKTRHLERYAETTFGLWGGQEVIGLRADTTAEYHAVTTPLYRRIPQEISMPELPPVLPTMIRETPLTPKQRRAYDQMERTMLAELNELLVAPDPLVQLTRLTQFASASAEVDEAGRVRLTAPSAKVDDLVELLAELGDEPLVVAAESRQLIELAAERLRRERVSHGLVTGAVAPVDRATSVRRFQDGGIRVILLTLAAGSEGLTLTRASRMLFMQVSYSPMVNHQAEGRIRRFGSEIHDSIQYIQQLAPGTVEERREAVIAGKEGRVEELWRDREVLLRLLGGDT
jgi:SNF2 family DNA or RNA helicase